MRWIPSYIDFLGMFLYSSSLLVCILGLPMSCQFVIGYFYWLGIWLGQTWELESGDSLSNVDICVQTLECWVKHDVIHYWGRPHVVYLDISVETKSLFNYIHDEKLLAPKLFKSNIFMLEMIRHCTSANALMIKVEIAMRRGQLNCPLRDACVHWTIN